MKLYEITKEIRELELLDDADAIKVQAEMLNIIFKDKALLIARLAKEWGADIDSIDIEVARLSSRKKVIQNKIDSLKEYLMQNMILNDMSKIEDSIITLAIRKNPVSCEVLDIKLVPEMFTRIVPETIAPDKTKIIEHFKNTGELLPGINMITDKVRLDIK